MAGEVEVVGLLTTVNEAFDRVAMHAVRRPLLEAQAAAVGLPLVTVPVPWPCSNDVYEAAWRRALAAARDEKRVTHVAFGDLFLEDVRAYRERQLRGTPLEPLFPLWGRSTGALARDMVAGGLRAVLTCIDPRRLPRSFAGRDFDGRLLAEFPADVDPCGEAGEFHTFARDGPMFGTPLRPAVGEIVERDGFVFADLVDSEDRAPSATDAGANFSGAVFDADGALSREFLLHRGTCCRNGCRNCPYGFGTLAERPAAP
jgi:diphthamide synthase (EF-2-diphthine--ammonia ligase)